VRGITPSTGANTSKIAKQTNICDLQVNTNDFDGSKTATLTRMPLYRPTSPDLPTPLHTLCPSKARLKVSKFPSPVLSKTANHTSLHQFPLNSYSFSTSAQQHATSSGGF